VKGFNSKVSSHYQARLFFADFLPKASHLKRMELCELYLDSFLHRSSRSILDAIWSGVPILTLPAFPELQRWTTPSTSVRTRLPSSILSSVFPLEVRNHTIATSVYDFQTRAMVIGKQPWNWKGSYMTVKREAKRISHRNQGKQEEEVAVLFDVSKFVENLEKGFRMAWERYLTGKAPINLVV
jgi:hypothetical protein